MFVNSISLVVAKTSSDKPFADKVAALTLIV